MLDAAIVLDALPRERFVYGPTPVCALHRLRDALGGPKRVPNLLMKRDDLNGVALGGNKLRKLEFLVGAALAQEYDTLVTAGAAQSNHCRQTAGVGAMCGLETHLCLRGPEPERHTGNLVLNDWLGAHLHFAPPGNDVSLYMETVADELRAQHRKPYVIPIGGSNAVGTLGYVAAARELVTQLPDADYYVVAVGSGGTMAGLLAGVRVFGPEKTKVIGVGVAEPDTDSWQTDVSRLANQALGLLGKADSVAPADVECPMDWMGKHYAAPTFAVESAICLLARTEGVFLDPVYSGKAFAALLDWCQSGRFAPTETVVFWHTGGTPALFAEGH